MEPLIATDWLKDFDPLFDLFDEEMGAQTADQLSSSPFSLDAHFEDVCSNHTKQQASDELGLLLGLEWLPWIDLCLVESARSSDKPTNNGLGSTGLPSPSHSCASSPGSVVAPEPVSQAPVSQGFSTPVARHQLQVATKKQLVVSTGQPITRLDKVHKADSSHVIGQSNSSGTPVVLPARNACKSQGRSSSGSSSSPLYRETSRCSSIRSSSLERSLKKRKKSHLPKGTSLLAQPSPKSVQIRQPNTTHIINFTLATNSQSSSSSAASSSLAASPQHHATQFSSRLHLTPQQVIQTSKQATTIITVPPISLATTITTTNSSATTNKQTTTPETAIRCRLRIEHSYARQPSG